jgi:hypothetical protein
MTRKMKVVLIITHVAVLAIGLVAGFYSSFAHYAREGMKMTSQGAMISHYGLRVDIQRNKGDRDAYRNSLIAYLGIMDDILKHPSEFFTAKTTSVDIMLIYERLARLEREAGNAKAADDYMNLAVQTCGNTGWKDCSNEKITRISREIEEKSLIPPKSSEGMDIKTK